MVNTPLSTAGRQGFLEIDVGQVVVVTDTTQEGWWTGYIKGGDPRQLGLFPQNYVALLTPARSTRVPGLNISESHSETPEH